VTGVDPKSFGVEDGNEGEAEYLTHAEMRRRERENLFVVLQKTGWRIKGVDGAAELLGVKPTTLISRIEKMGLKRPA
jgi:transcriptional regulator with GAF, ATPase, and Fis domain